jgi:indole-3-glycerol phosphate synthase
VIAEVKRSSPSKGAINPGLDAAAQAAAYDTGGAAAISVLTEPTRFGGSLEDLAAVKAASGKPVLKKDFHVAEWQLEEAARLGADAALIIVRAIEPSMLRSMSVLAQGLGVEILYEIRDESELERALEAGARMIGVNNRNLETLEVDPTTVERIVPLIPAECVAVAESGYGSRGDIERAASAGADAVLIGSVLSASADPARTLADFIGIRRVTRLGTR